MASSKPATDATREVNTKGEFVRTESSFRDILTEADAEAGRYHLVVSLACPWACRCLMVRSLKGLQDAISVSVVHPVWA